jgi:hypothetical protein
MMISTRVRWKNKGKRKDRIGRPIEYGEISYYQHNVSADQKGSCYTVNNKAERAKSGIPFLREVRADKVEVAVLEHLLQELNSERLFKEVFGGPDHGVWVSKNGKGTRVEVRFLYPTTVFHLD